MLKAGAIRKLPAPGRAAAGGARIFAAMLLASAPLFCSAQEARGTGTARANAGACANIVRMDTARREPSVAIDSFNAVFRGGMLEIRVNGGSLLRDPRVGWHFPGTAPVKISGSAKREEGRTILYIEALARTGQVVMVNYTYPDKAGLDRQGRDRGGITHARKWSEIFLADAPAK
ncbi:MAG: hypothetical protein WC263_02135 [Candidatus Micrarchaeia archaeon]